MVLHDCSYVITISEEEAVKREREKEKNVRVISLF